VGGSETRCDRFEIKHFAGATATGSEVQHFAGANAAGSEV
jgi:hypothetical protein